MLLLLINNFVKNFIELQEVLKGIFATERKYLEVSRKVQVPELSRFLNHQNIVRNKYINDLTEAFAFNEIELAVFDIEHGIIESDFNEINIELNHKKQAYVSLVHSCLKLDQKLIKACIVCLKNNKIPLDILEVLTKICTSLIFNGIDGNNKIEEFKAKELEKQQIELQKNRSSYFYKNS
ncbi:hypothetical protein D1815_15975 [Aquimarina sp. AD1]|nr:hypothetical protein D1815_15975 [Aquimarina sp. AD1]RKN35845.1 hypothetical protein D7035_02850 [Aquimarina sp. AD1]